MKRSIYTFVLLYEFGVFVLVGVLPSVSLYTSVYRIAFPVLVITCVYWALHFQALAFPFQYVPAAFPWYEAPKSRRHRANAFGLLSGLVTLFYPWFFCLLFALESNPVPGQALAYSPCGQSSCTALYAQPTAYNPNGYFDGKSVPSYDLFDTTIGVYQDCNWANQTLGLVYGYPVASNVTVQCPDTSQPRCSVTQTCYATTRTEDYPDWSVGVAEFFEPCSLVTDQPVLCQGSYLSNGRVYGLQPCAWCDYYWATVLGYVQPGKEYCVAAQAQLRKENISSNVNEGVWCGGLVPRPDEVRTPSAQMGQLIYVSILVWSLLFGNWCVQECIFSVKRLLDARDAYEDMAKRSTTSS